MMPTVATLGVLLVHNPPGVVLVSGVHAPIHTVDEPIIGLGDGFTVTGNVT
jgi:hypothetical protein